MRGSPRRCPSCTGPIVPRSPPGCARQARRHGRARRQPVARLLRRPDRAGVRRHRRHCCRLHQVRRRQRRRDRAAHHVGAVATIAADRHLAVGIDHFGKVAETGTRGSSAKEGHADTVLALLADREINGTISNTRLAVRKQRDGIVRARTAIHAEDRGESAPTPTATRSPGW